MIHTDAEVHGTGSPDVSAKVDYTFSPEFHLAANEKKTTGPIPKVLLNRGLLASLELLGKNTDYYLKITARVGGSNGKFKM